jgi:hypothetical protein
MPYRRLPNTDAARLRAMKIAKEKYDRLGASAVPFSARTANIVRGLIPTFERAIADYKTAMNAQSEKNVRYQQMVRTARMYVSHFIQVLNLSCQRHEIKPEKRLMYKLLPDNYTVPDLSTEALLMEWGKNIIDGEMERLRQTPGGAIYNPSIGKVKVYFDQFADAYQLKKVSQKNAGRYLDTVQTMRKEVDAAILQLWNEIEESFANLGVEGMQEKSKEFGIVYYLRRKERKLLGLPVSGDEDED